MRTKIVVVLAILILSFISGAVIASASTNQTSHVSEIDSNRTFTSDLGIEYTTNFNNSSRILSISASNPKQESVTSWLYIRLDRTTIRNQEFNLSAGESRHLTYNVSEAIASGTSTHNLQIDTMGNGTQYNFSLNVSSATPRGVPLPEIDNVEISETTIHDEQTPILKVTVVNEAEVGYLTNLHVSTIHTESNTRVVVVPPNETRRTVTIVLNESPDTVIGGEVRLFTGQIYDESRISDQVEFEGRVNGETRVWDREFEPIQVDYADRDVDEYHYHNASIERKNDDIWRERLKPVAVLAGAMLVAILLAVALLSRRR